MTIYNVTTQVTKLAWKRDNSIPAGQPAPGRFDCPCGNTISGIMFADGTEHACTCGHVYDSRGWLISEPI